MPIWTSRKTFERARERPAAARLKLRPKSHLVFKKSFSCHTIGDERDVQASKLNGRSAISHIDGVYGKPHGACNECDVGSGTL